MLSIVHFIDIFADKDKRKHFRTDVEGEWGDGGEGTVGEYGEKGNGRVG